MSTASGIPSVFDVGLPTIDYTSAQSPDEAQAIRGKGSSDILTILGAGGRAEMIHRDDLALGVEDDAARAGGALVEGEQVGRRGCRVHGATTQVTPASASTPS